MSQSDNNNHTNSPSTRPGVGTRIKGVFQTVHGIGENVRGRTLEAIDNLTTSGPPGTGKSRHGSIADRGRMEVETGMAHIYGHPDPHAGNVSRNEPGRIPEPVTGTFGNGHATGTGPGGMGHTDTGETDYERHGRGNGDAEGEFGKGQSGSETSGRYGRHGAQNHEDQPVIDRNTETGLDLGGRGDTSPNHGPQNPSEGGWSSKPQTEAFTPTQQRMGPQTRAADNDQHKQMYQ